MNSETTEPVQGFYASQPEQLPETLPDGTIWKMGVGYRIYGATLVGSGPLRDFYRAVHTERLTDGQRQAGGYIDAKEIDWATVPKPRELYVPKPGERFRVVEKHPKWCEGLSVGEEFEVVVGAAGTVGAWASGDRDWLCVKKEGAIYFCRAEPAPLEPAIEQQPKPGDWCEGITAAGSDFGAGVVVQGKLSSTTDATLAWLVYEFLADGGLRCETMLTVERASLKVAEQPYLIVGQVYSVSKTLSTPERRGRLECVDADGYAKLRMTYSSFFYANIQTLRLAVAEGRPSARCVPETAPAPPPTEEPTDQAPVPPPPGFYVPRIGEWVKVTELAPEPPPGTTRSLRVGDIVKTEFGYAIEGHWVMLQAIADGGHTDWCRVTPADELDVAWVLRRQRAWRRELMARYREETRGGHDWEPPEDFEVNR